MPDESLPRPVFLRGPDVYLRPLALGDVDHFLIWLNDPDVRRHLLFFQPLTERMEREYIESEGKDPTRITFAIARSAGDQLIGATGLHGIRWKDRVATWGIFIGPADQQGRGYGTQAVQLVVQYAFETLNLNRLEMEVFASNPRAIRVYEKLGFVREGLRREARYIEGRYVDELLYSMLAREYFARREHTGVGAGGT